MCTEVLVIRNGQRIYCETVGDLARALGVRQKAVSPDGFKFCLCNAYLDKLGARRATDEECSPFGGYVIEVEPT